MSAADLNRGLLWGQLLSGLESAGTLLKQAQRGNYLLTQKDRDLLDQAQKIISGVEQRAWEQQQADAAKKKGSKP